MSKLGTVEVWLDDICLQWLLTKTKTDKMPRNMNIFKRDPRGTTYSSHKPVKIKLEIYKDENGI